jgi:transcriptional regulator with XRE-family HTH domain
VSAIKQRRRQPSLMTLAKLAKGLGVRLEDLVAGVSEDDDKNGAALGRIAQLVRAMSRNKAALAVELVKTLAKNQ